ncbi:hypothetical protein B4U80_05831 [Leptotrombidium deliense]|uniref:CUB domain-containing protein n=1 Tax=Leptotrombidium deliense TaxID=299467 RepID=A0A443SKQ3_9ACAR|nr:hypothetical protein B4U80_05831 [Leptotrombidium deliense]
MVNVYNLRNIAMESMIAETAVTSTQAAQVNANISHSFHIATHCSDLECNQTVYGEIGNKYPLRLTEPLQKFHPFSCEILFSAIGGKFGDIVELTFLSFQIGSFHIKKVT